MKFMWRSYRER